MITETILDVQFTNTTMDELVDYLSLRIDEMKRTFVVTANPEIVMYAKQDPVFRDIVKRADVVTPDGIGIIIAGKLLKMPLKERVTGYDLLHRLLSASEKKDYRIYFLGASAETIENAVEKARALYPNAQIVGYHDGYFSDEEAVVSDLKRLAPDIVFVGLGSPKQEKWINDHLSDFQQGLFIGVGGCFDVLAGNIKRAPIVWQKLNIEWLYRLIQEPSRWKRMMALPAFLIDVLKVRFRKQ